MHIGYHTVTLSPGEKGEFLFSSLRIVRLADGFCQWRIGRHTVALSNGDIVLLNNLTPRSILESKDLVLDIFEFTSTHLQGYPSLLGAFYQNEPVIILHRTDPFIDQTFALLAKSLKTQPKSPFTLQLTAAAMCLMDCHTATLGHAKPSGIAFQAASYIWEHYREDLSVSTVAKQLNISKNHLETGFKRVHGVGVGAYIRLIRLHHAQQLLTAEPDRSVLDIAFSCGFKSSAGFYKAYKSVYNIPPGRKK